MTSKPTNEQGPVECPECAYPVGGETPGPLTKEILSLRAELARVRKAADEMLAALRSLVEMCAAAGYEDDNDGMREARAAIVAYDATKEGT